MSTIHLLLTDQAPYDDSTPELRVTSAHASDQAARLALADLVLTEGQLVRGARIDTVEIAGELAPAQHQGDRDAILATVSRFPDSDWGRQQSADAIMAVVGQRMADARTMARQDAMGQVATEALRDVLGPLGASVQQRSPAELLDLVRDLVKGREAWAGRGLLDVDGLVRAAQVLRCGELNEGWWASRSGHLQDADLDVARDVVRAYLHES